MIYVWRSFEKYCFFGPLLLLFTFYFSIDDISDRAVVRLLAQRSGRA